MMKRILLLVLSLIPAYVQAASVRDTLEVFELTDEYLDTVSVHKRKAINNYSMIGVNYGVSLCNMTFNPSRHNRQAQFCPNYFSVMYTHYEKLFGYIQNFALHVGFAYGHEGVGFKTDPDTGEYLGSVDGANKLTMEVFEVPVLAGFHFDAAPVKFEGAVGVYGGWRKSIERWGVGLKADDPCLNSFKDYELRFDYGLQGGLGFAVMLDPVEIHFNAMVRWGWQSLYQPNYYSEYYYRYAYPLDLTFSVGVHYQLTRRTGKTNRVLRKEAREKVYGKTEDSAR